ncbi:MAG: Ig-like domain-containing protein [Tannerella sp.]|nr:Ig-like domain-containing protein [Tannerella sp.]
MKMWITFLVVFLISCSRDNTESLTDIRVDRASLTMIVGESVQLTATPVPDEAGADFVWTTDDATVATVTGSGLVFAVAEGSTNVYVSNRDGSVKVGIPVTVAKKSIPIEDIRLSVDEVSLIVGETVTVIATPVPANADATTFVWSSENESIASVSAEGVISGHSAGATRVTVATPAGDIRKEIPVTVAKKSIPIEDIRLSVDEVSLIVGETVTVIATPVPTDADATTFVWSSENELVASVSAEGVISGHSIGETRVTVATPAGDIRKEIPVTVSRRYPGELVNTTAPFAITDEGYWEWGRFGTAAGWTHSPSTGYLTVDSYNGKMVLMSGWGLNGDVPLLNGKIYQTLSLPAGTYHFRVHIDWIGGHDEDIIYVTATKGAVLPDTEALTFDGNVLTMDVRGSWTSDSDVDCIFTLTDPVTTVSLGVVANIYPNSDVQISSFSLEKLY